MIFRSLLTLSLFLSVAGCSTAPRSEEPARIAKLATPVPELPVEGLPPQKLAPGECGLFLWGMSAPRRFVFFAKASSATALFLHEGAPLQVALTDTGGEVFGQFFTETTYMTATGDMAVELVLTPGDILEGGQQVRSGRIVSRGKDGWETVLPVTGARACMPG